MLLQNVIKFISGLEIVEKKEELLIEQFSIRKYWLHRNETTCGDLWVPVGIRPKGRKPFGWTEGKIIFSNKKKNAKYFRYLSFKVASIFPK